jgi:hypothetical protein
MDNKPLSKEHKYPEEALADEILAGLKDKGLTIYNIIKALDKAKSLLSLTTFSGAPTVSERWP